MAAFATIVFLLGLNFVAVRFSNRELAPFWGSGLRFALAALLLFGIATIRKVGLPRGATLQGAIVYGLLAFGASYAFLYWGMVHVPAGMASVLFATVPLLTFVIAASIRMEAFRWRGLVGGLLALAGIALVFREQLTASVPLTSMLSVLAGALMGALSGIVLKRTPRANPISVNAVGMTAGAALLLAGSLLAGEPLTMPTLPETWMAFAWLVTTSIIGFILFAWLIARWSASATSYVTVMFPLVAVAGGALLAGETVTPVFLLGAVIVIAGVYVGALSGGPRPATGPAREQAAGNPPAPRTRR